MGVKLKPGENAMLALIEEIYQQTEKMCMAGPGPGGFGVSNENPSDIGIYIAFKPSPIKDNAVFPEDIPDYEVSVRAFDKTDQRELSAKEVAELLQSGNAATRRIAGAATGLSKESRHVTKEECWEAFDTLAQKEIQGLQAVCAETEEPQERISGPVLC